MIETTVKAKLLDTTKSIALAAGKKGEQSYLPTSEQERLSFEPHAWVVEAVHSAYKAGQHDSCKLEAMNKHAIEVLESMKTSTVLVDEELFVNTYNGALSDAQHAILNPKKAEE